MRDYLTQIMVDMIERGWLPEVIVRWGIRRLLSQRLRSFPRDQPGRAMAVAQFVEQMNASPVAPLPEKANEQHYEVPSELYGWILGPRRKYSSGYYAHSHASLAEAEEAALQLTCEHAALADGQEVLELGCGWGSLTLWMLEHFPHAKITAVSNSHSQREYIEGVARERGFAERLQVITADMNQFTTAHRFDRVVSVEMFEHMRNYRELLRRVASWLRPEGKLFVHIFCHRELLYPFETAGAANWMGRYFFSGGIMPSFQIFSHFSRDMQVEQTWEWNGTHYQRTAEAWVANLDRHRSIIMPILVHTYGPRDAERWFQRWRLLFLAGAELFGYRQGEEWLVGHYLLQPTQQQMRNDDSTPVARFVH